MTGAGLGGYGADTGPLYALADGSDQFHRRAHSELLEIDKRGLAVATSSRQWLTEVFEGTVLLNPVAADYLVAAQQLKRFGDHPITLVDAVTATMSGRLELPVWSFDRHFATMRTAVWSL